MAELLCRLSVQTFPSPRAVSPREKLRPRCRGAARVIDCGPGITARRGTWGSRRAMGPWGCLCFSSLQPGAPHSSGFCRPRAPNVGVCPARAPHPSRAAPAAVHVCARGSACVCPRQCMRVPAAVHACARSRACVCPRQFLRVPAALGGGEFPQRELGVAGAKGLCAGGNSAEHQAPAREVFVGSLRIVPKAPKSHCPCEKAPICFLVFIFVIKIKNFRQLLFGLPLEGSSHNFRDPNVNHIYSPSLARVTIPSF